MLTGVDHIFQTIYKHLVTSCEIYGKVSNKLFSLDLQIRTRGNFVSTCKER